MSEGAIPSPATIHIINTLKFVIMKQVLKDEVLIKWFLFGLIAPIAFVIICALGSIGE